MANNAEQGDREPGVVQPGCTRSLHGNHAEALSEDRH